MRIIRIKFILASAFLLASHLTGVPGLGGKQLENSLLNRPDLNRAYAPIKPGLRTGSRALYALTSACKPLFLLEFYNIPSACGGHPFPERGAHIT